MENTCQFSKHEHLYSTAQPSGVEFATVIDLPPKGEMPTTNKETPKFLSYKSLRIYILIGIAGIAFLIAVITLGTTRTSLKDHSIIQENLAKSIEQNYERVKSQLNLLLTLPLFPPSCAYIKKITHQSGTYVISPDPLRVLPFNVSCNLAGTSTETIIHHDSEAEIQVSNCEPTRCYKRTIQYTVSLKQIEALIDRSSQCRQFIKYRCIGSTLSYGAWLSRDRTLKTYWGGAASNRTGYCGCGENGNCADTNYLCNCNINDHTQRYDEGYLTNKADLPVTGLQFGDAGDTGEYGWHKLGPLICSGTI